MAGLELILITALNILLSAFSAEDADDAGDTDDGAEADPAAADEGLDPSVDLVALAAQTMTAP